MKILHVSDSYLPRVGGIELHLQDLTTRQQAAGDDVTLATLVPDPPPAAAPATSEPVVRLPASGVVPHPRALLELGRMISSGRYDIVHAHSSVVSPLAWYAAGAAAKAGVPAVLTMHSMLPPHVGVLSGRRGSARSSRVVLTAVSSAAAAALRRARPGHEVTVLPNGIDPQTWAAHSPPQTSRPLTIVSVLRTVRRKRPLALVEMLEAIRRELPATVPLRAVLVGSGPLDDKVSQRLARSGADRWVHQAGHLGREAIRDLLHRSDLYLAPATLESFGIAALEARCAGLAVIGMARGGAGDFIQHGTEGFLVESDAAMVAQAARLLAEPTLLRQIQHHNQTTPPAITWPRVLDLHAATYAAASALAQEHGPAAERAPMEFAAQSPVGAAVRSSRTGPGLGEEPDA